MSDYITLEIQEEIIKRLPVTSLIRFRSVSKAWKALIDSPKFIANTFRCTQPHHLLIRDEGIGRVEEKRYVCLVDDDTFPQQKFVPTVPVSVKLLRYSQVIGSSGGLLCLHGYHPDCGKEIAVLWNPSIRKSVAIDVPKMKYESYNTFLGFGVCSVTSDPKILNFRWSPWEVVVYALSSGQWRTLSCNVLSQSIRVIWSQVVVVDRFIYWLALDRIAINGGFRTSYKIISFDLTTDDFRDVCLPNSLTRPNDPWKVEMSISKVWESLVVIECFMDADNRNCVVWMMEDSVPKSFTKSFTIKTPYASMKTLGFNKRDEAIMVKTYFESHNALVVYEPNSERFNDLGISGSCSFSMNSYMETLLLLNQ